MLLAIFLPWLSFIVRVKIFSAILSLILQITLIGWLPAALWALNSRNNAKVDKKIKQMESRLSNQK